MAADDLDPVYSSLPVAVALLDNDLCFVRLNERFTELIAESNPKNPGVPMSVATPRLYERLRQFLMEVLTTGRPVTNLLTPQDSVILPGPDQLVFDLHPWVDSDEAVRGIHLVARPHVIGDVKTQCEERLRFENLLADASACFVNVPHDQVDSEVEAAQRRVCDFLQLDRSSVWQYIDENHSVMQLTHLYQPSQDPVGPGSTGGGFVMGDNWRGQSPEGTSGFGHVEADRHFPWIGEQLRNRRPVVIHRVDDLPDEVAIDRTFLHRYGTKSTVILPMSEGGRLIGVITFAMLREAREWSDYHLEKFHAIARIFTHALLRKHMDEALRNSEARLSLAAEVSKTGLWELNPEHGEVWATEKARELLGLTPDETLDFDKLIGLVHPEDTAIFQQNVAGSACSGNFMECDFRIVLPDGGIRWLTSRGRSRVFEPAGFVRIIGVVVDITERKLVEEQLRDSLRENAELRKKIEAENLYLRDEYQSLSEHDEIIGQSKAIKKIFVQIDQVGPTDSHVLITGETGTGKELVARALHAVSARKGRIMVKVNCATLPSTLIESELFGREKGAYTGALTRQIGRFEMANGGTIFLDEIGDLAIELQAKLLRVLQEGEFERLGSSKTIRVDVRVIAATNCDLVQAINKGTFRKDLLYRLSVFPIHVPPLRERAEDIPQLVWTFIEYFNRRMGKNIKTVSQGAMDRLGRYPWHGNVRELRNSIERAMIMSRGDRLELPSFEESMAEPASTKKFKEAEQQIIMDALRQAEWHIKGPKGAANLLGLKPSTLYTKMKTLGIRNPQSRDVNPT